MPDTWMIFAAVAKLGLYLGALNAVGLVLVGTVFVRKLPKALWHGRAVGWTGVTLVFSLAVFCIRGSELTGTLAGFWDLEILSLLWQTANGDALVWRLVGIAGLAAGLILPGRRSWLALLGGSVLLWSFTQVGHLTELSERWVAGLLWLHLVAVAFWIGILSPLQRLMRAPGLSDVAAEVGEDFGRIAVFVLPVLAAAGGIIAWHLLGTFAALGTGYGLWLLGKLAAVLLLLTIGAANKLRYVPSLAAENPGAAEHLMQALRLEQAVFAAVLSATASLTSFVSLPV